MSKRVTDHLQRGVTLIELLISMAIGMVIIAAMVYVYAAGSTATRNAQALGQMNEDGQMALAVITQELRNAGYNPSRAGVRNNLGQGGLSLIACDNGFTSASLSNVNMSALICNAAATTTGAELAIVYEADTSMGKLSKTAPTQLQDCIGSGVSLSGVAPNQYYIMQSRLYVKNGGLRCKGGGDLTKEEVLAENIESMTLSFAMKDPSGANPQSVYGYLTETGISADAQLAAMTQVDRWDKVAAVRVCVVVVSESAVLQDLQESGTPPIYKNCNGVSTNIIDNRMRRTYRTTVILRNHGVGYADS